MDRTPPFHGGNVGFDSHTRHQIQRNNMTTAKEVSSPLDLTAMVRDGKKVKFTHYVGGDLWYQTECGFSFPVPTSDIGSATFLVEDKALLFMRWIKPHIKLIQGAKITQDSTNTTA